MIKISSLTRERREGKAALTVDEGGEVRTEEIRISFLKPTEALWRELIEIEVAEGATDLVVGVLQNAPYTGEQATYRFGGTTKVISAGTIAIGAMVTTDGSGKAVTTTTEGDVVIGRYVGTAAAAASDIIEVQMGVTSLAT